MKTFNIKLTFLLLVLAGLMWSCDDFKDPNNYSTDEFEKSLDGNWRINKVTRNGIDITKSMDFSAFRIAFAADKTYKIENYLPFLVKNSGTWDIDDPQYPTTLTFKETGVQDSHISDFEYTIVEGERQITLVFSPGCQANVYMYVLGKVSN